MSMDELPVILVAAKDASAANKIISELIEKNVSAESDPQNVWEISNKYYTACVQLQAVCDAGPALHVDRVEAHIVYLAEDECCSGETLERRAGRARAAAGGAGGAGHVRLALADCHWPGGQPETLQVAALRLNFELVSLRAAAGQSEGEGEGEAGPFPERWGLARARDALHAHMWPGLQLAADVSPFAAWASACAEEGSDSASSDGAGGDSEAEPDEAECVRRAELFADALCAIEGVRGATATGGGGDAGAGAERLLRAEQLVAAFCRALGTELDAL